MQWCCLLALAISRAPPPVMMGGLTGLPRMPVKAWALTKKWYTADFDETAASAGRQLASQCLRWQRVEARPSLRPTSMATCRLGSRDEYV